ncbi:MAG: aminotransferase class IV [Verrucomicrobiota bacterium]
MIVFLNGRFVPEEHAVVSVFDRGFLYGDGLFEAIPILNGRPFRWPQHWQRFLHGAALLKIQTPFAEDRLRELAAQLAAQNQMPDALLRLALSRGVGPRGYSPKGADSPNFVMTLHAQPGRPGADVPPFALVTSSLRLLAGDPLAHFKHANKLPQILARAEADAAGADEALLLNTDGHVVEGTTSNLFWIEDGTVLTPPLAGGILPGVTRSTVFELGPSLGFKVREENTSAERLIKSDGVFLSLSSWGIAAAKSLDGFSLRSSALTEKIHRAYWELVIAGTSQSAK